MTKKEKIIGLHLRQLAIKYWYNHPHQILTGGEYHAYLVHHFLNQRLVIPLPDLWLILLAALVGAGTVYLEQNRFLQRQKIVIVLIAGTVIYSLFSLELYISAAAIALPIFLPISTIWIYVLPRLLKQKS